ncbi:MAG: tRNA pseudouridine(55) synthase TruB, partial [Synechococcaceae cyanobacterium RL_1_2]|nr:tRNA pseudouridine(55) synthase TruB [Synechococcaceae cyanobacterium RL_1_2]
LPPRYSAIKQDGKKLYELARQGKTIEVPLRQVTITAIEILDWQGAQRDRGPELKIKVDCGEGTYIRSLARDLGAKIGCGATLAKLERTLSCGLQLQESMDFSEIEARVSSNNFEFIAPETLLNHWPTFRLNSQQAHQWSLGQKITGVDHLTVDQWFVGKDDQDNFLGMAIVQEREGQILLAPKVAFSPKS